MFTGAKLTETSGGSVSVFYVSIGFWYLSGFTARRYASAVLDVVACPIVRHTPVLKLLITRSGRMDEAEWWHLGYMYAYRPMQT